jgi:hypothetical protein
MLETQVKLPQREIEFAEDRPIMDKKVRPHRQTHVIRKNYKLVPQNAI